MSSTSDAGITATRITTPILVVLALILFAAGVFTPFFQVQKFWIFGDAVSVVSGLIDLLDAGEWFLFGIIFLFTLIFPTVKLIALGIVWWERERNDERADRILRFVSHLSKWSMLDVFIVAILVVILKSASVARISVDLGVYLFTASVVLTQVIAIRLERRLK